MITVKCGHQFCMVDKKAVYYILVNCNISPACTSKWSQQYPTRTEWKAVFAKAHKITPDPQLKWFQVRLLHRLLPTKRFLYLRKLVDAKDCTFCGVEEETLSHLFWNCHYVQDFWNRFQNWLCNNCCNCTPPIFSEQLILFGSDGNFRTDGVIDLLILIGKFYVYTCRLQETLPNFIAFTSIVKDRYSIERYRCFTHGLGHKFRLAWFPYLSLVE